MDKNILGDLDYLPEEGKARMPIDQLQIRERLLKEVDSKLTENSIALMPNLLSYLKHDDPVVVRQSVSIGTSLFCAVVTEMALQLHNFNKVEEWLEELWSRILQFKDAIRDMLEHGSIGSKVLAAKFLETCVLLFTSDANDGEGGKERNFNLSWLVPGHPTLNPTMLAYEASNILACFFDILQSARTVCGSLVIATINCLASIAKRRPVHYESILSSLLDFDPNFETSVGGHNASIQYAVRLALLGFLRCTHSSMLESRDKLLRVLRLKYPGEGTEQTIRQMEKLSRSTTRLNKDDPPSTATFALPGNGRERPLIDLGDGFSVSDEMPSKRARFNASVVTTLPVKPVSDSHDAIDDISSNTSVASSDLTPAEKMIVAIGAILAEGDKGAQSLELLLSQIDADLLADMVIETMKHLPKKEVSLSGRNGSMQPNSETISSSVSSQTGPILTSAISSQPSTLSSEITSTVAGSTGINLLASDVSSPPNFVPDFKRDPRRDPRRLDPRRAETSVSGSSLSLNSDRVSDMQFVTNNSSSSSTLWEPLQVEKDAISLTSTIEPELSESSVDPATDQQTSEENLESINGSMEMDPSIEGPVSSDLVLSPIHDAHQEFTTSLEIEENEGVDGNMLEPDQYSSVSVTMSSEDFSHEFPVQPHFVELTNEQKKALCKLAIRRLSEDYKHIKASGCSRSCLPLLARLVAQTDADNDLVTFFQTHIILDYHHNKGHDLAMHVLYHLHAIMISESEEHPSLASNNYEKFLLAVAKTLLVSLPASDKSFCMLLGEAPFLPKSAFKLLEDLCQLRGYENHAKDTCDGDRVTQGLGALWSLILERPSYRQICLDIALKCAVHSHDEVRAKAIRLVANKLFHLSYASESIEKFAQSTLFSVADRQVSDSEIKHVVSGEQMAETASQETSVSGSHNSELGPSESDHVLGIQVSTKSILTMSLLHAHQQTSLFFSLCTKKPSLLHIVFNIYGRTPKVVKQAIHRHIHGLLRTLGPSYPELLQIISDLPEGSESLVMLVLQLITEESTPSADLIAAVKHLYNTKLKDVALLIPMLSSLSKDEVLPIFPRLVDLPLEKFQSALARILQGSAHTGPALTPVEVLIAIHDVNPAKDGVALKKITDACTACFEQRTVFTQQVLAKSLSHMVEQVPLPMLFMRTVIQAVGSFPALVDFVMGILSILVNKQIWKMPKLWVGFLKLISQTHPNSFNVLLQLPPPQLENALNKYANLRGPLSAFANQPNVRATLARPMLQILGLEDETQQAPSSRPFPPAAALHTSETSSSFQSATLS